MIAAAPSGYSNIPSLIRHSSFEFLHLFETFFQSSGVSTSTLPSGQRILVTDCGLASSRCLAPWRSSMAASAAKQDFAKQHGGPTAPPYSDAAIGLPPPDQAAMRLRITAPSRCG